MNLPIEGEYKGPNTGSRETCQKASISQSFSQQQINKPYIIDYDNLFRADYWIEDEILGGPLLARLWINTKIQQFYKFGVLTQEQCDSGSEQTFYYAAVTGFNRLGVNGSKPFYQLRGSFGPNWGMNGSLRIEKYNDAYQYSCQFGYALMSFTAKTY